MLLIRAHVPVRSLLFSYKRRKVHNFNKKSLETTTPHVRRCPFIFAVLYTQVPTVPPPNRWPGCIYDLPLYDTLYIINLQCTHSL